MRWTPVLTVTTATVLATAGAAFADIPTNYVGVGIRAGLNDPTAAVIDSKIKLFDASEVNELTASVRPALVLGDNAELRLPISVETEFGQGFYPFIGAGIAYNADGRSAVEAMATGGIDIDVSNNLVLNVELNVLFKSNDTDTELVASINYAF